MVHVVQSSAKTGNLPVQETFSLQNPLIKESYVFKYLISLEKCLQYLVDFFLFEPMNSMSYPGSNEVYKCAASSVIVLPISKS